MAENTRETVQEEQAAETAAKQETAKDDKKSKKDKKDIKASLEQRIAELEEQLAKEKDDYLRLRAEFENYRRRTSEERLNLIKTAGEETIKGMLTTLDNCEHAIAMLADATDIAAAKEGTELIYSNLMGYLKSKGLSVIEAKGKEFDTDLHEAIALFPVQDENLKGKVMEVAKTGYTLGGTVIRFASVVVGQ